MHASIICPLLSVDVNYGLQGSSLCERLNHQNRIYSLDILLSHVDSVISGSFCRARIVYSYVRVKQVNNRRFLLSKHPFYEITQVYVLYKASGTCVF